MDVLDSCAQGLRVEEGERLQVHEVARLDKTHPVPGRVPGLGAGTDRGLLVVCHVPLDSTSASRRSKAAQPL